MGHLPALVVNIADWLQAAVDGDAGIDLRAIVVQRPQAVLAKGRHQCLRWGQRERLLLQSSQTLASGCQVLLTPVSVHLLWVEAMLALICLPLWCRALRKQPLPRL